MEKTFRKMTTGFLSLLLMSMMFVTAGVGVTPFISDNEANVAVIYGANAAATDSTAADTLVNSLADGIITQEELDRILSSGVTENKVKLGSSLSDIFSRPLTDNKIDSLFDGKISWDNGEDTKRYNVHEEIIVGDINIKTSLDDNDFKEVVLTNNEGLEYRYVFEDAFDTEGLLGDEDADPLEVIILGEEYLIEEVDGDTITVTQAEKKILIGGESITFEGTTLTIDGVYEEGVIINGVLVKNGRRKTINGVEVKIEDIFYTNSDTSSTVSLYYGGEISKEYSDGDGFIGEDDDDPEWVWSISDITSDDGGYIGVRYNLRQVDEDDDVVYEGEEYTFPNDFATVSFDSLTDVDYHEYEVSFEKVELYVKHSPGKNGVHSTKRSVVVIKGDNDDSFELKDGVETDTLYLVKDGTKVAVYYMDIEEDFSTGKPVEYMVMQSAASTTLTDALTEAQGVLDTTEAALTAAQDIFSAEEVDLIAAQDVLDTASTAATTAQDVLDTAEAALTAAQGFLNTAETDATEADDAYVSALIAWGAAYDTYELSPTEENLNVLEENWDILVLAEADLINAEAALTAAQDVLDTAEAALTAAQDVLDTAEAALTAAQDVLDTAEADLTAAQDVLDTAEAALTAAQTVVDGAAEAVASVIDFDTIIATLIADDTEFKVGITGDENITLTIDNIEISLGDNFAYLGSEEEDVESNDVIVSGEPIGKEDNDVMDYYGTIIESPEDNADDDKVILRIPSKQVYAEISVLGSEEDLDGIVVNNPTPAELNITKITDTSIATAAGKNIIVVGGSCINTMAETLLGGKYCGAEFTAQTGVVAGKVLIQTFSRGDGTVATLVAGYNGADTMRGVTYLLNNNVNIAVGKKIII